MPICAEKTESGTHLLCWAAFGLIYRQKELQVDHTPVPLTKSEYLICEYLARNKGQVFSKEQIYEAVFYLDGESDSSTIATHIKNIRAKLAKQNVQPNCDGLGDWVQMGLKITH